MDKTAVAQQIIDFLKSVMADDTLTPSTDLVEAGVVDSLTMMDLVSFIEGRYEFPLAVNDLTPANFQSAQTLANLVEQRASLDSSRNAA